MLLGWTHSGRQGGLWIVNILTYVDTTATAIAMARASAAAPAEVADREREYQRILAGLGDQVPCLRAFRGRA